MDGSYQYTDGITGMGRTRRCRLEFCFKMKLGGWQIAGLAWLAWAKGRWRWRCVWGGEQKCQNEVGDN